MCTVSARQPARKLDVDEAVHPIRRHCTSSDRVYSDVTGASRRNGCTVARSGSAEGLLGDRGRTLPRVGLLLSGVTPLSGVLHQLGGGVMLPNWCNAP